MIFNEHYVEGLHFKQQLAEIRNLTTDSSGWPGGLIHKYLEKRLTFEIERALKSVYPDEIATLYYQGGALGKAFEARISAHIGDDLYDIKASVTPVEENWVCLLHYDPPLASYQLFGNQDELLSEALYVKPLEVDLEDADEEGSDEPPGFSGPSVGPLVDKRYTFYLDAALSKPFMWNKDGVMIQGGTNSKKTATKFKVHYMTKKNQQLYIWDAKSN